MAGLGSLSKSLASRLGERRAQVVLIELDKDDKPLGEGMAFQYFPESISDTKQVNYQTKEIPGASLPLYQWISSGERVISFTASFSSDLDLTQDSTVFSKFLANGLVRRNIDARSAVAWLRRFQLPRYGAASQLGTPLTNAPHKLMLYIQNSGLGLSGGVAGIADDAVVGGSNTQTTRMTTRIGIDDQFDPISFNSVESVSLTDPKSITTPSGDRIAAIMLQCDVTYQAFFTSGLPRYIEVSLAFAQTAQVGGVITFPADSDAMAGIVKDGSGEVSSSPIYPYPFRVRIG